MKHLSGDVKSYIVQCLACFVSPSEVVKAVKEVYGVEVTRQQVGFYDPSKGDGAERLGQTLRDLFTVTRLRFMTSADDIGIAHLTVRLASLQRMFDRAEERGDDVFAAQILKQAAKEVGGFYVRNDAGRKARNADLARLLALSSPPVDLNDWRDTRTRAA